MSGIDSVDVLAVAPVILVAGAISAVNFILIAAIYTKRLQVTDRGFGRVALSLGRFIAIQVAALLIGAAAAYALYWTPVWPLSMTASLLGPAIGAGIAFRWYKARRLPVVVSLPVLLGLGLMLGNQAAIFQRAIEAAN